MPSVSATATAAAAIFSTFRVALGPRVEAARIPVAVALTALSLVPPFFQDADAGTVTGLVVLHLTAAAIAIPSLARRLTD